MSDPLEGFSEPRPLARTELHDVPDEQAVHVVWDAAGAPLYVGYSGRTRERLREHLAGDRQASILHHKLGLELDVELAREATAEDIESRLNDCSFQFKLSDRPKALKAQLMAKLSPRFNEVLPSPEEPDDGGDPPLGDLLREVLEELRRPQAPTAAAATYRDVVLASLPRVLAQQVPPDHTIKGSVGYGSRADVPWVSIFRKGVDNTAQEGVYVVYLFAADGSAVYLTLAQGVSNVKGGTTVLTKRALDIRTAIASRAEWLERIDLQSDNDLPRKYEASAAYAVAYRPDAIPSSDVLARDLADMLAALEQAEAAGLTGLPAVEPVHLVMKWSKDIRSDTIPQHKTIADSRGSVWWGKFGAAGTNAMGAARLELIRKQLSGGVETWCFLYRNGELWRARLRAITPHKEDIDPSRMPDYYTTSECILFLELTDFEEIHPPTWALSNLLLASDPHPSKTQGALSNQTSPILVYLRGPSPAIEAQPEAAPRGDAMDEAYSPEAPAVPALDMDWLVEQTLCEREWLEEVVATLQRRPQIVLAGPPGTSKTWIAEALARYLTQDEPLARGLVQFHASYGYEEFIEGLRPEPVVGGGGIRFARVDGSVLRMASQIKEDEDQKHVLVIDEMNRANLPRVFGELMYLLEYRDKPVDLLYTQGFTLPRNLLFIGTMNTADRSIRSIDLALRRRFEVFECPPSRRILESFYKTAKCEVPDLLAGFEKLNTRLTELLDRHHTVGHSFFMADPLTHHLLQAAWTRQLQPLFEEYFFDDHSVAASLKIEEFWPSVASTSDTH